MTGEPDPVIRRLREQVSETDRAIVGAVNRRLELVAELKRHKDARGMAFLDPEREERMLRELERWNPGPLSADGLHELFGGLLDLTKREVGRLEGR